MSAPCLSVRAFHYKLEEAEDRISPTYSFVGMGFTTLISRATFA